MDLQTLYFGDENGPFSGYDCARAAKVVEIRKYIEPFLARGVRVDEVAESLMSTAEVNGSIVGNRVQGEIAVQYTILGNPIAFSI